jgi:hypothetical protein
VDSSFFFLKVCQYLLSRVVQVRLRQNLFQDPTSYDSPTPSPCFHNASIAILLLRQ